MRLKPPLNKLHLNSDDRGDRNKVAPKGVLQTSHPFYILHTAKDTEKYLRASISSQEREMVYHEYKLPKP